MTEPAASTESNLRRVVIEPLTRVEGHGKVTLLLDADGHVQQARLHIVEFRGFEKFIEGRPYWEAPVLVQRLCGICPVSHHLAAAKAMDQIIGVSALTPTADGLRRLMHYGQILQSHALHFFHLAAPDLLFGFEAEPARRNLVGIAAEYPDIARQGVLLRRFGQEVIRVTAGKRVHGTSAVPGGVNKRLSPAERDSLRAELPDILTWAEAAVHLARQLYAAQATRHADFAHIDPHELCLVDADGGMALYDGGLRARQRDGGTLFDHLPVTGYADVLREAVQPWSYMKFPFFTALGEADGWYRVGPLARVRQCDFIPTPRADAARREFLAHDDGRAARATLGTHWARMIELLHAAEMIACLLDDDVLLGDDLLAPATLPDTATRVGIGVIEAPRGTLIHHYEVDADDLITRCNLIVSTTHNNSAMNAALRDVAHRYLDGNTLTEGLLNHIEVAIRAFDPCLSCATHALGKMPLQVELRDADETLIAQHTRNRAA